MFRICLSFFLLSVPILSAATMLSSMTKVQLQKAFVGKTFISIGVDNLNGKTINTSNGVYMNKDGAVYGSLGSKPTGLPQYDQGRYQIKQDGTIYITWNHWDDSKKLCFHMFETKNAYLSIDCDNVYHSTFMKANIKDGNHIKE